MTPARWCRGGALLIAVLGLIDPALTLARSPHPTVSIVDTSGTAAVTDRVARTLASDATVVRGLTADAAAVVVVGHRLPAFATDMTTPAFVVTPDGAAVDIERLSGPAQSALDARASFIAALHVRGARGQTVSVSLAADGLVLDRVNRTIADDDVRLGVPLTFVPSSIGPARVRVTATLSGSPVTAVADTLTRVDRSTWTIFAFDPRPSWMATFVRRALEDDNRFAVTSRTVTSRAAATNTPAAPQDFGDSSSLDRFDAIVVGAPDALTASGVGHLEAYLARRGGAVILLWDVRPTGPALGLMGVERWQFDTRAADRPITAPAGAMRASDLAWPARLPAGASTIGSADAAPAAGADPTQTASVIWQLDRGPGRVVVSGALDAWRYRDAPQSSFDSLWRRIVADAAQASPPPLAIDVTPVVARPGEPLTIHARVREAELAAWLAEAASGAHIQTTIAVKLTNTATGETRTLRAWPEGAPGRFVATTNSPATAGVYAIAATSGAATAATDLIVDSAASHASPAEDDALAAWATSRGGHVVSEAAAGQIGDAVRHLPAPTAAPELTHPMRSGWWMAPMTLLLGVEWWTRRRRGLK